MPSDLSVSAVARTQAYAADTSLEHGVVPAAAPASASSVPTKMYPNPSLHIDPASDIVVIEFHDSQGKLTSSVPTLSQLEAYRQALLGKPEPNVAMTTATDDQTVRSPPTSGQGGG